MNPAKRHEIFSRLRAANPDPTTELEYTTPFELLVAVVLSAQSTDKGVNLATCRLFPVANTPEAIHALGEAGLAEYIRTIGLQTGVKLGDYQFERAAKWEKKKLLALVGMGIEPGVADVFARYVDMHLFDEIDEIGVRDGSDIEVRG